MTVLNLTGRVRITSFGVPLPAEILLLEEPPAPKYYCPSCSPKGSRSMTSHCGGARGFINAKKAKPPKNCTIIDSFDGDYRKQTVPLLKAEVGFQDL
eukprot:scaffold11561_cov151-Cylindrotheca_fusiformis.AAC.7